MRRLVCGDIHGHYDKLMQVLDRANYSPSDLFIGIGDIADRGPKSYEVAEFLLEMENKILIRGNHDIWVQNYMIENDFLNDEDLRLWFRQGGRQTLDSYGRYGLDNPGDYFENRENHLKLYRSMLPYKVIDNMCFVHGGFNRWHKIADQMPEMLSWNRELAHQMQSCSKKDKLKTVDGFDWIFIGHTPTINWDMDVPGVGRRPCTKPINKGGVINVDTGVCYDGKLTVMDIDTQEYWQSE